jgi:TRAP-type C4-dicarboxylate transport system substrate-binding protein
LFRGTIDAITTSLTYGWNRGFADIVDSVTYWPQVITLGFSFPFIANLDSFNAMPPDLQQILVKVTHEVGREQHLAMQSQLLYVRRAIDKETTLIRAPEAEVQKALALTEGVADEWVAIAGPDAPELLRIVREIVADYRAYTGGK